VTPGSADRHALVGDAWLAGMKRRFQFKFLSSRGLRPEHRLLDIGCGTLRGGIPLIDYLDCGNYVGVESRPKVLEEGRRELVESGFEHKRPLLINAAHPAEIEPEAPFDFAWAFSVLFHMPDEVVDAYLSFVSGALAERGELYANVLLGDGPPEKWCGFPVVERPREQYERWAVSHGLSIDDIGTLESLGHRTGVDGDEMTMLRFTPAASQ
jgi:cyclopropane fatty-acyl-phospholipid synthase-like methyltransferase